jgi:hypothetical protein
MREHIQELLKQLTPQQRIDLLASLLKEETRNNAIRINDMQMRQNVNHGQK